MTQSSTLEYAVLGNVFDGSQVHPDSAVLISDGLVRSILPRSDIAGGIPVHDFRDCWVAPGFIDLQLNGCGGVDFNTETAADALAKMNETNLRFGTTGFLPTLITSTEEHMRLAVEVVLAARKVGIAGVLGIHLEGPYLNPAKKGMHLAQLFRTPSPQMIDFLCEAAKQLPILLTFAPEVVAPEAVNRWLEAGIHLSIGHSNATYVEARAALDRGVRLGTHLFNAMSAWSSREPGVVGALLATDAMTGIVADGIHVHPASLQLAHRLKNEQLFLITDAFSPVGSDLTSFRIGDQTVYIRGDRLLTAEGALGGSLLTMIVAVANAIDFLAITPPQAFRLASYCPARAIGMDQDYGSILQSKPANFVILRQDLKVQATVQAGRYRPS
jgi:N-acetylglucosamine-6-phosphate deacetylase